MIHLEQLKYPIGNFVWDERNADTATWIDEIEALPAALREAVHGWSDEWLDTPYRPEGWSSRQVVHHLADSHMNSYIRMKLAATENDPVVKPYAEELWALLPDAAEPPEVSLQLLNALHRRWVVFLRGLGPDALQRKFLHPVNGPTRLDEAIGIYAWHGKHHLAHITRLAEREGWLA
ncbi:putative metal-dependent hydrolase [Paenibacillus sp. TRM 82003]|nr:putative metal-dependent hydrolase [Paenibacillus sp. TRM 82003]